MPWAARPAVSAIRLARVSGRLAVLIHSRILRLVERGKPSHCRRVERLAAGGLMAPAGLAAVEAATQNGSWSALDDVENLTEPDDLKAALDRAPEARSLLERDQPLRALRGVTRSCERLSSSLRDWLSTQPKHSASSTMSA